MKQRWSLSILRFRVYILDNLHFWRNSFTWRNYFWFLQLYYIKNSNITTNLSLFCCSESFKILSSSSSPSGIWFWKLDKTSSDKSFSSSSDSSSSLSISSSAGDISSVLSCFKSVIWSSSIDVLLGNFIISGRIPIKI